MCVLEVSCHCPLILYFVQRFGAATMLTTLTYHTVLPHHSATRLSFSYGVLFRL